MKILRLFVLFLMIIPGLTIFAQPGYYPPPAAVGYYNDTLTIFPPDSLPGDPVILMDYNVYVDNAFWNNIPVTNPEDTVIYLIDFHTLLPGDHSFCVKAVYNQWISEPTCDTAVIIYGYELPITEDWSSGSFEELQWTSSSGNWVISDEEGNPAPAAEFRGNPAQTDYSETLESFPVNAVGMIEGKIRLDFDLKLDCTQPTGKESLQIQVWNWKYKEWTTVAQYFNDEGSFTWDDEHINIKPQAMNKVFKVRFQAAGSNSADIQGWLVDNIRIYRDCWEATDLHLVEFVDHNQLLWIPSWVGCGDYWMHWDDGLFSGTSIGTGGAVEFDVAARWDSNMLPQYQGSLITKISFIPAEPSATYNVRIWTGDGPDTMLIDQLVPNPVMYQWNQITLATPITLDITKDLWVGYHVNTPTGYPAGVDSGPTKDGYGNMMNFGGWQTLLQINPELDYNWNISCNLTAIGEDHLVSYNIYRQTNNEGFQFYDNQDRLEYLDSNINLSDHYCYKVTAIWAKDSDTCESVPTDTVCETVNVGTKDQQQENSIRIYPNPTSNLLNIESDEEIREIRIYNVMGEEVLKLEIGNLEKKLDVSRLQSGIYYLNVTTVDREFKSKVVLLK